MNDSVKVVLAQQKFLVGDIELNAQKILDIAHYSKKEFQANVVVYPELAITGYPPEDLLLRDELHDRVDAAIQYILPNTKDIVLVFGVPLRSANNTITNSAIVVSNGEIIAVYNKQELPNYSVFDEKRYFIPGTQASTFEYNGVTFGLTICEDIWFEGPAKQSVEAGAEILLNLNASPFHVGKNVERLSVLQERVTETGVPILYTNMVGGQDELVFDGASMVVFESGVVAKGALFSEQRYLVELVRGAGEKIQIKETTLSTDWPTDIETAYQAIVNAVRDYITDNGFDGAVLGLSGGIDSALTLAIACDAIGADKVTAVMMPSQYTASMSLDDAKKQAETLGCQYHVVPIKPLFDGFLDQLSPIFSEMPVDTTEENIQARCRGVLLMAMSNKFRQILLTTGNKSEMAVGYATLYGDMAGGFAPLKDVPKTMVYSMSRYRNSLGDVIPERVITRAPSAELRPDQKDEDSLPPYDTLDQILEMYIERDYSVEEIVHCGFGVDDVFEVAQLVDRNEYKRRQAPPGVRISRRAFGKDRRYPITSGFGQKSLL